MREPREKAEGRKPAVGDFGGVERLFRWAHHAERDRNVEISTRMSKSNRRRKVTTVRAAVVSGINCNHLYSYVKALPNKSRGVVRRWRQGEEPLLSREIIVRCVP